MAIETCTWHGDGDGSDCWETDCHNAFRLEEGSPADNGMKFCCYCGRPLVTDDVPAPDLE